MATTNQEFQEKVEKRLGKPLKDIMYELCVIRDVIAAEGADELDVPKNTFISWRNQYRFGPMQLQADNAEKIRQRKINKYNKELEKIDFNREFRFSGEQSIQGFQEIVERLLEVEKYKRTKSDNEINDERSLVIRIATLEQTLNYLKRYSEDKLYEDYFREVNTMNDQNPS